MRFKFIPPFQLENLSLSDRYRNIQLQYIKEIEDEGLLDGIEWDIDPGVPGPHVDSREELAYIVPGILNIVREVSNSGRYDAIIILGGLDPGLYEAREISRIPVVGCTHSAIHIASLLGHKFSVIDATESMAIKIRHNIMMYGLNEKCASVRSIQLFAEERREAWKTASKTWIDKAVQEAVNAIDNDGADVITFGCTGLMWMQPHVQKRLKELGYDVPVLHSIKCAVEVAKALVNMKQTHSKMAFPHLAKREKAIPR
ncbi:MAG: aspartate/glutamate racemase family protein [Candidatus Bathyarchaeia archaeon]